MIQTNIKKLFMEAGLEEVRPSDDALAEMGIHRRRFSQLLENSNKTPINVNELEALKSWISGFQGIDIDKLVGTVRHETDLSHRLGLSK